MTTKETVLQRMIYLKLVANRDDGERYLSEINIAGFGKTGAQLINEGRADALLDYIERVAEGGYA